MDVLLAQLAQGRPLDAGQAEALFDELLNGRLAEGQIIALLSAIQARGATIDELIGAARVMRRHVMRVPFTPANDRPTILVDTCGTGGTPKTFNISTAAALVAAAASPHHTGPGPRVCVAKHGNRSRTGRGSAEVLAALGVNVDASPEIQARCLDHAGVCFCFAIHHHPAMRHAAAARKAVGTTTIFNLLGPLTNPAGALHQLIGVYDAKLVEPVAYALAGLGARRALVVHSADGMDEISITAPTRIAAVAAHPDAGSGGMQALVTISELDPRSLGFGPASLQDLAVADVAASATAIRDILAGQPGPRRDIVLLNAAGALLVAEAADTWAQALHAAAQAIDSGGAAATLDRLIQASRAE